MKMNILSVLNLFLCLIFFSESSEAAANDSVFVGLGDGSVYKCHALPVPKIETGDTTSTTKTDQCIKLDSFKDPVTSMVSVNGSLYVGTGGGYMWICNPAQADSCINLNTFGSEITALVYSGHDHRIYAGTAGGTILKCPLKKKDSCENVDNLARRIEDIDVSGGNQYVATDKMYNDKKGWPYWCSGVDNCVYYPIEGEGSVLSVKHSKGNVYFGNSQISRCPEIPNSTCSSFYTPDDKGSVQFEDMVVVRSRLISLTSKGSIVSCPIGHDNSSSCTETYLPIQATRMVHGRTDSDILYYYRGTDLKFTRMITNNSYDLFKFDSNIYSILYVRGVK